MGQGAYGAHAARAARLTSPPHTAESSHRRRSSPPSLSAASAAAQRLLSCCLLRLLTGWRCAAEHTQASAQPLPEATTAQLKAFNDMRKTWRAAIRAAAFVGRTPITAMAPRTMSQKLHTPTLPPGAIDELKEAFRAYDVDGNGTIELGELQRVMRSLGAAEGQAELVLKAADVLHTGSINFEEFCAAVGPIYSHSERALRRAFDVFDQDGNGTIDRDELRVMMTKLK